MDFIDLKAQLAGIREDVEKRIQTVLEHGAFILGPEVAELENALASFCGAKHCVACASGTDALLLAMMAEGVGRGDAIFTSPFTFIATAEVISLLGATPVFVDAKPDTFNLDPEALDKALQGYSGPAKPKGIVAVDIFGQPAEYDALKRIAQTHNLFLHEDAAQSFGGECKGVKAGALCTVAATSFFPAKPLGAYGDGGAVLTSSDEIADMLKSLRVHGKGNNKYDNVRIGVNGRLDTLQAAILLAKLAVFPDEVKKRQVVAERYTNALKNTAKTPVVLDGYLSAWAQYTIQVDDREKLASSLKAEGIPAAVYYPKPLHLQPAFGDLGYREGGFPVAEELSRRVISLPMHPYLEEEEQDRVIAAIKKALTPVG